MSTTVQEERQVVRHSYCRDLEVEYEGYGGAIEVRAPDISPHGMFINTPRIVPEGAVLKIQFRLRNSRDPVMARAEVRYCLPGVGVGVEFVDISEEAQEAISSEYCTL